MNTTAFLGTVPTRLLWIFTLLLFSISRGGDARAEPAGATNAGTARADALLGEWWTEKNEGRVRFTKDADGTLRGTTTCCKHEKGDPDNPATDIHNPDPKLRGRSTVGIVIIWKLAYEDGEYSGGYVYNPRDGKTYRIAAEIIDDSTVKIRGYMLIPLLGQSQIWKRARVEKPAAAR
jgi:uncharacterized protein (DUF2147 family)